MFTTWGNTQEVGWVRYAFDQFEVRYDLIYKERDQARAICARAYDVIVIPSQGGAAARKGLVFDIEPQAGKPIAYKKDAEFPSLGAYGERDDITGGMGLRRRRARQVRQAGGVLITLGAASFFPAEFGITRTVDAARTTPQFYAPGPDRRGGDPAARAPDLLRLHEDDGAGALGQRPAAARARRTERRNVLMQFSGQRHERPERPDARRRRDPRTVRRSSTAGRARAAW